MLFSKKRVIISRSHRGIVQSVEHQSPKLGVVGSSPSAPAKKAKPQGLAFFICAARHNIICVQRTQHHLSVSSTSLPPRAAQMNDVAPLVQMKLPSANEVMLRINDVALPANGIRLVVLYAEIKLIFS